MDKDHDNRLGDNDFTQSVREDPLLLSCFGQVFANARVNHFHSSCLDFISSMIIDISSIQIVETFLHFFSEKTHLRPHRY